MCWKFKAYKFFFQDKIRARGKLNFTRQIIGNFELIMSQGVVFQTHTQSIHKQLHSKDIA